VMSPSIVAPYGGGVETEMVGALPKADKLPVLGWSLYPCPITGVIPVSLSAPAGGFTDLPRIGCVPVSERIPVPPEHTLPRRIAVPLTPASVIPATVGVASVPTTGRADVPDTDTVAVLGIKARLTPGVVPIAETAPVLGRRGVSVTVWSTAFLPDANRVAVPG